MEAYTVPLPASDSSCSPRSLSSLGRCGRVSPVPDSPGAGCAAADCFLSDAHDGLGSPVLTSEAALPGALPMSPSDYLWSPVSGSQRGSTSSQGQTTATDAEAAGPAVPEVGGLATPLHADCQPAAAAPQVDGLPPLPLLDSVPAAGGQPTSPVAAQHSAQLVSSESQDVTTLPSSGLSTPQPDDHTDLFAPLLGGESGAESDDLSRSPSSRTLFAQPICKQTNAVPPAQASQDQTAPCPRFGHTAVVYKDLMVVYGGRDAKCYDDVWAYCFQSKKWRKIAHSQTEQERPRARAGHTAVVHRSHMYVFGGVAEQDGGGSHTLWLSDMWTLNLETWVWTQVRCRGGNVPDKRKGHTAVVHKRSMFVFGGGQDDTTMHSDLWEFSFTTQKWILRKYTGHTPQARMYHVAVVGHGGRLLVFGGRAQTTTGFLNDLFEINLSTFVCDLLTPAGPAPTHRMCSTAVYHNHTLAIFTGGSYAYLEDSHQLDLRKMQWMPIDNVRFGGRTRPTTVKWRNTVLTFGGCVHGNGYVNDFIELELEPMSLKQCMKQYMLEHKMCLKGEGVPSAVLGYIDE